MKPFFLFCFLICSCKSNSSVLNVWIENNSDENKNIEISTYVNDSLVDKRNITKDSIADRISTFKVDLNFPSVPKRYVVKFVSSPFGEETSCLLIADSLNKRTLMHVNYVKRLFKKGNELDNRILMKDTVVRKEFYCEILYHAR